MSDLWYNSWFATEMISDILKGESKHYNRLRFAIIRRIANGKSLTETQKCFLGLPSKFSKGK